MSNYARFFLKPLGSNLGKSQTLAETALLMKKIIVFEKANSSF